MKHSQYRQRHSTDAQETETAQGADGKSDREFYIRQLASEECLCGQGKLKGNSFCRPCYKALPDGMQKSLYRSLGYGYEQAVDAAVVWLQKNWW